MSMSIGSLGGYGTASLYSGVNGAQRNQPRLDTTQLAENLFAKLDADQQGYFEVSDLESAFSELGTGAEISASEVFTRLDSDEDGKITENELASSLKALADELDSQYNTMRMSGMDAMGGARGMPPPPPPPSQGEDQGLTQNELTSISETTTDSQLADLLGTLASNFEAADANRDGRVTHEEAMTYQSSNSTSDASSVTSGASSNEATIMRRIMELVRAYGSEDSQPSLISSLSVTA